VLWIFIVSKKQEQHNKHRGISSFVQIALTSSKSSTIPNNLTTVEKQYSIKKQNLENINMWQSFLIKNLSQQRQQKSKIDKNKLKNKNDIHVWNCVVDSLSVAPATLLSSSLYEAWHQFHEFFSFMKRTIDGSTCQYIPIRLEPYEKSIWWTVVIFVSTKKKDLEDWYHRSLSFKLST
jgi:hypothetical protein